MKNINSAIALKNAIILLEADQAVKERLLKEHVYLTFESLKPVNLLRSSLRDISTTPDLINNLLGTSVGLASGFISKKIFVGASGNMIRKLLGVVLQLGVTNIVAQNPEAIKSFVQVIINRFFHREKTKS
jgi:hypothetical protein